MDITVPDEDMPWPRFVLPRRLQVLRKGAAKTCPKCVRTANVPDMTRKGDRPKVIETWAAVDTKGQRAPGRGPLAIHFEWAAVGDPPRFECIGLNVRTYLHDHVVAGYRDTWQGPVDPSAELTITAERMRLPIAEIIREARDELGAQLERDGFPEEVTRPWRERKPHGLELSRGEYDEVARVYREAWYRGDNPTAAVQAAFSLSYSGAAKRVLRARRAGALPLTRQGKSGFEENR